MSGLRNMKQSIAIGVNNPEDVVVNWKNRTVGLILPENFRPVYSSQSVQLPDKRYLHNLGTVGALLPGGWETLELHASIDQSKGKPGMTAAELKIFTDSGPQNTNFYLNFIETN
jgi:hypothetical protein